MNTSQIVPAQSRTHGKSYLFFFTPKLYPVLAGVNHLVPAECKVVPDKHSISITLKLKAPIPIYRWVSSLSVCPPVFSETARYTLTKLCVRVLYVLRQNPIEFGAN